LAHRRVLEISRRISHLPSPVVRLGAFEFVLGRRVGDFTALVAEIESQVFSVVGLLLTAAERTIEWIVGVRLLPNFPGASGFIARWLGHLALDRCALRRFRRLNPPNRNLRRGRDRSPQFCAMLALDYVALDRRLEGARARPRGANRARLLRFILGGFRSHFTHFRRHRIRVEHVAASRALEGRCIVGQDPFIDPIAGVATGALNFDHSTTSHPADEIITRQWVAHLLCAPRNADSAAIPRSVGRCG